MNPINIYYIYSSSITITRENVQLIYSNTLSTSSSFRTSSRHDCSRAAHIDSAMQDDFNSNCGILVMLTLLCKGPFLKDVLRILGYLPPPPPSWSNFVRVPDRLLYKDN